METIVISVGGSLIVPGEIDVDFLKSFKDLISNYVESKKFVIITGGGKVSRKYQEAAKALGIVNSEDLDWLGIHGTRLNAHLFRTIFREHANPKIVKDPTEEIDFNEAILIACGWKPGWSTDYDATLLAANVNAAKLVNLTNVDYVYDKDPKEHSDAKPIKETTWSEFRKLLPEDWNPGLNAPFDPVAAKEAEMMGIEVAIINGKNLDELKNYLDGKSFEGTIIKQ